MKLGRVLVLSPHRDDEILGCGGTLAQLTKPISILYFNDVHPAVEQAVYDKEAAAVAESLGATTFYSHYKWVNRLDHFSIKTFVEEIEQTVALTHPKTILIPAPDYNQDHRVVYQAALTAIRTHDKNWYVPNVLLYEQPETHTPNHTTFTPNLFMPIDIDAKLGLYSLYASQVRGHRSPDHIRALASFRGMYCNQPYAEAFQVVRITA